MSKNIQAEFRALQDHQKLLTIMIFSLVTVVIWVVASLIRSQRTDTIDRELTALSRPLNPSINTEVLTEIEQKRVYTEAELSTFPVYVRRTRDPVVSPFSGTTLTEDEAQPEVNVESLFAPAETSSPAATLPTPTPTPTSTPTETPLF